MTNTYLLSDFISGAKLQSGFILNNRTPGITSRILDINTVTNARHQAVRKGILGG